MSHTATLVFNSCLTHSENAVPEKDQPLLRSSKPPRRWGKTLAEILLVLLIVVLSWRIGIQVDNKMREELLEKTLIAGKSIDLAKLRALSGSTQDLNKAEYTQLKAQLASMRQANEKYRFLYVMAKRSNGEIYFIADSEPETSPDYSPPGQVYNESSELFEAVFVDGGPFVEGPDTDQWGTWISACVPIIDPKTGERLGMFGMDIDASTWQRQVIAELSQSVGLLVLFMITALALAESIFRRREEQRLRGLNSMLEAEKGRADLMANEATKANETKSAFLAMVTHEIRTPVNGTIGVLGLLSKTPLSDDQKYYVGLISRSMKTVQTLLNDILDISKIEAGKLEIEMADFNLLKTMSDLSEVLGLTARNKGLNFSIGLNQNVPAHLVGDPNRLAQILTNLVGNAIKFTNQGSVSISVDVVSQTEDKVVLCFSVEDTGQGIPEDKQDLVFKDYNQIDISTARVFGGTGLGLSISRQLVEKMGGEIGFSSHFGAGTKFWFTVPLLKR